MKLSLKYDENVPYPTMEGAVIFSSSDDIYSYYKQLLGVG